MVNTMSYPVGTHIDLHHLNKKVVPTAQKKSSYQGAKELWEVGTQFVFRLTPAGLQAAIKIPVAMY